MISGNVRPAIGRMIQRLSPRAVASEPVAVVVPMEEIAVVSESAVCLVDAGLVSPDQEPIAIVEEESDRNESSSERAQFEAVMTRMMEENESLRERLRSSERCAQQLAESSVEAGELGEVIGDIAERMSIAVLNLSIHVSRAQGSQTGETGRRLLSATEELARLSERAGQSAKRLARWSEGIEPLVAEAAISEAATEGVGVC